MEVDRVSVTEAAQRLGITEGAMRKRVARGTVTHERDEDGRVWIFLDQGYARRGAERQDPGQPGGQDIPRGWAGHGQPAGQPAEERAENDRYTQSLEEQLAYLRDQLDQERAANRENRRLLAAALERIPEIEAPDASPKPQNQPESAEPQPDKGNVSGEPESGAQRPWWRRVLRK